MSTYLVVCGVILNIIVLLTVIYRVFDWIRVRKANKKARAKNAQIREQFKKELELAKLEWIEWVKELKELEQAYNQEANLVERILLRCKISNYEDFGTYFFPSIGKNLSLHRIGKENGWKLEEDIQEQQEKKTC
ncbi:MAG: hypothetical protein A2469_02845 [Candidatus Magasanikbacteria bacterium RIFOXYC2_FULL_40_16]|uniref:Uncharacterized protein n=2 Tax=Candidatus Magasanikiibacteriota TaxID=1752731 RepID=A0A1F6NFE0_9BACT|nr:MAG: hypothetical protein A2373_03800 [Candidatus Magasanikbacteria bacterium RIFOXYB1_FULL_40_15]OGH86408.1 MAG: hypothetical protein A2301_03295 [Candidatus Magasanikbacteria bacterium RIFOXYB2_FULL_40_13]OGH89716.1 MAG: hypothetical protein A2469_02845 [Candidatus Magasanikbacteria bacterium RIFOXYC2_FULL_40_16]